MASLRNVVSVDASLYFKRLLGFLGLLVGDDAGVLQGVERLGKRTDRCEILVDCRDESATGADEQQSIFLPLGDLEDSLRLIRFHTSKLVDLRENDKAKAHKGNSRLRYAIFVTSNFTVSEQAFSQLLACFFISLEMTRKKRIVGKDF